MKLLKKISHATLLVIFSTSIFAQEKSISINYKPGFSYFGKQKQDFSNFYFKSRNGKQTFTSAINFLYSHTIFKHTSVISGIEYSQQGQNIDFKVNSPIPEQTDDIFTVELSYFRLPVLLEYLLVQKKIYIGVYAGVSLGITLQKKDNYQDIILESILLPPANKRYENIDISLPVGISLQKKLNAKVLAKFGIEYLSGLTNSFTKSGGGDFGVLSEFKNSKQNKLSVNLGIDFKIKK